MARGGDVVVVVVDIAVDVVLDGRWGRVGVVLLETPAVAASSAGDHRSKPGAVAATVGVAWPCSCS